MPKHSARHHRRHAVIGSLTQIAGVIIVAAPVVLSLPGYGHHSEALWWLVICLPIGLAAVVGGQILLHDAGQARHRHHQDT
jgi:hypothetical protein